LWRATATLRQRLTRPETVLHARLKQQGLLVAQEKQVKWRFAPEKYGGDPYEGISVTSLDAFSFIFFTNLLNDEYTDQRYLDSLNDSKSTNGPPR
jgi:hypothetical protein